MIANSTAKFVYVIGANADHHKIGVSINPEFRLAQLQTASPLPLRLAYTTAEMLDAAERIEAHAHWLLRDCRLSGEWFHIGVEDALKAVAAAVLAVRAGTDVIERQQAEALKGMSAEDFSAWVATMKERGWNKSECARRLACGVNQIKRWSETGAPRYIGLACTALAENVPAWRLENAS